VVAVSGPSGDDYLAIRDGYRLEELQKKFAPGDLVGSIEPINSAVRDANGYVVQPQNKYETISNDTRIRLFLLAGVLRHRTRGLGGRSGVSTSADVRRKEDPLV
jgi:hypothetical protein